MRPPLELPRRLQTPRGVSPLVFARCSLYCFILFLIEVISVAKFAVTTGPLTD